MPAPGVHNKGGSLLLSLCPRFQTAPSQSVLLKAVGSQISTLHLRLVWLFETHTLTTLCGTPVRPAATSGSQETRGG